MAKEFIRHLEYYGFPDQNTFSTEGNVDLSDIIKKNEEQDQAIANLGEQEWVSQEELNHLNDKVNTFIETQNDINNGIEEDVSIIKEDVNILKTNSNLFSEELSGVTQAVNNLLEETEVIDAKITELSADTNSKFDDVYTKEEIDEKTSDIVTISWINEQGFITRESGDDTYASKDEIQQINQEIQGVSGDLNTLEGNFNNFSSEIENRVDTIDTRVTALEEWKDVADGEINASKDAIISLIQNKANVSDLNSLSASFETIESRFETIESDFDTLRNDVEDYKGQTNAALQELSYTTIDIANSKADNSAVTVVSQSVVNEANERQAKDSELSGAIASNAATIRTNTSNISSLRTDLNTLENSIATERNDRVSADAAIIGNNTDDETKNTVWGAKALANDNLRSAKEYANNKATETLTASKAYTAQYITDNVSLPLNGKADTEYVNSLNNETKSLISEQINTAVTSLETSIANEVVRAQTRENFLEGSINTIASGLNTVSTRLGAITEWQGTDPTAYSDNGNGVLDVMHRELHQLNVNFATLIQQLRDNYNINIQL